MIDIARSDAYLTCRLAKPDPTARDPHRQFVTALDSELMNGEWSEAPSEGRMLYRSRTASISSADHGIMSNIPTPQRLARNDVTSVRDCRAVASNQIHDKKSRKKNVDAA